MKRCGYCGRENADEAIQCHECGTPDLSLAEVTALAQAERVNPQAEQSILAWLMEKVRGL